MGDFLDSPYEAKLRRSEGRVQLQLAREGTVAGRTMHVTKGLTLNAGSGTLEIAYLLENVPGDITLHFAPELNFAGMPGGADDRYFLDAQGHRLGQLNHLLDLADANELGLVDEWLGIAVALEADRPTGFWTYPVETVSQSEGGFELVHQSVVVQPHWIIVPDAEGRWSVTMTMAIDTTKAEQRKGINEAVATV